MSMHSARILGDLNIPYKDQVAPIICAALSAVDPYKAVMEALEINEKELRIGERIYDLDRLNDIYLVGIGKAAYPMMSAAVDKLGIKIKAGILVTKKGFLYQGENLENASSPIQVFEAGHPVPDQEGVAAARAIEIILSGTLAEDLVICLISGGGSALLTAPANGIRLDDLQALTDWLLRSGATINELNTLRKHCEKLKGGGLAKLIFPAEGASLLLSDVIGDTLDVIASGPTVPDPSSFSDCVEIIKRYDLTDKIPISIRNRLELGAKRKISETAKPGDLIFERMSAMILANNYRAALAATQQAELQGFNSLLLTSTLDGEARDAGRFAAAVLNQIRNSGQPISPPACIVMGGETTVTVTGQGRGGRNLELALGAVEKLAGLQDVLLVSLATDGDDGATQAAGAFVSGSTLVEGLRLGMHPEEYLQRNDSFSYFDRINGLIVTGPTQTNVNDLVLLFCK